MAGQESKYNAGDKIKFRRLDGVVAEDTISWLTTQEGKPAMALTKHSWCFETDVVEHDPALTTVRIHEGLSMFSLAVKGGRVLSIIETRSNGGLSSKVTTVWNERMPHMSMTAVRLVQKFKKESK